MIVFIIIFAFLFCCIHFREEEMLQISWNCAFVTRGIPYEFEVDHQIKKMYDYIACHLYLEFP